VTDVTVQTNSSPRRRGQDFLTAGDFASARLLFKRAADAGNAEAALALGSTYDPAAVIKTTWGRLHHPDIESALKWYGIAADRGSAAAADHFAILMQAR
jgi:TPR repeat protein